MDTVYEPRLNCSITSHRFDDDRAIVLRYLELAADANSFKFVTGLAGEMKLIAGVERDKRILSVGIHNDLLVDGLLGFDGAVLHVDQCPLCNLRPREPLLPNDQGQRTVLRSAGPPCSSRLVRSQSVLKIPLGLRRQSRIATTSTNSASIL